MCVCVCVYVSSGLHTAAHQVFNPSEAMIATATPLDIMMKKAAVSKIKKVTFKTM